jgi:pilus assembly protein CpaE
MFNAIIIGPDPYRREVVHRAAVDSRQLSLHPALDRFPTSLEVIRLVKTSMPDIVFLDLSDAESATACAMQIRAKHPGAAFVGFGVDPNCRFVPEEHGFIAILQDQIEPKDFEAIVSRAIHSFRGGVDHRLIALLPSKAGSGCSTVVLHTAFALAASRRKKVLVIEGDLRSGALSILLNCTPEWSVQHALRASHEMDSFRFNGCISSKHGVDFLLSSNTSEGSLPGWHDYFHLLECALSKYDTVLVDLPELVNPATVEIVRRASTVWTVCTPEVPSLKLAQHRSEELAEWDVPGDRTRILVNRWQKSGLAILDIEKFLNRGISAVIPNDYQAVRTSLLSGNPFKPGSAIERAFREFALDLVDDPDADKALGDRFPMLPLGLRRLFNRA